MMQRKNKPKPSSSTNGGYGSGYESNDGQNYNSSSESNSRALSSPSKPPAPSSGGISIGALTGHAPSKSSGGRKQPKVAIATVKRNFCGTQPFDRHWLNLDCCGLICAGLTYCLHAYGVYSFGWILLPPWFSVMDEDGYRELTFGCHFHRFLFITIAFLAVYAHFKAMTTDPGAVPPDANPLPIVEENLDELDNLIKGEPSPTNSPRKQQHGGMNGMEMTDRGSMNTDSSLPNSRRGSSQSTNMSSSLMQEDSALEGSMNNGNGLASNNGLNNNGLPQAVATAGAVGAAVVGAAGVAAGAAVAGGAALASAAAPTKPRESPVPPSQQPRGRRMCRRCQAFKPPRAHHCSICKRCIIKMDHHCPWVNNCVGLGNHKYFLLFIFYTSLSCAYSFTFIVYRFFHCIGHSKHHHGPRCVDHPTDLLPLVGLTVEALLFGLFTICMMVDQWDVVMTNLTHIDRLKGETHQHHGGYRTQQHAGAYGQLPPHYHQHVAGSGRNIVNAARAGINEVFGCRPSSTTSPVLPTSRFHYTWLSPLHKVCFPENVRDDIFGYCRPTAAASAAAAAIGKGMEMVGRSGDKGRGGISGSEIV